jgi:hypothetical protein
MDLTTNGVVITDSIKHVNSKMEHLNKPEKGQLHDVQQKEEKDTIEQADIEGRKTNNGLF